MFLNFTCRNELCKMMFTCAFIQVSHRMLLNGLSCRFTIWCERLFNLCMKMHFARSPRQSEIYLLSPARGAALPLFDPVHHHNEVVTCDLQALLLPPSISSDKELLGRGAGCWN